MMLSPLQKRQIMIFAVGWVAYASTYFLRKPLGVIKTDLETDLRMDRARLGWLDTALLLPYALMQMMFSSLGDKFGPRKTLGVCLLFSAISMATFGFWSNFYMFSFLLFLNGTSQAMCWPNAMKALGQWFSDSSRNSIFGMFGTCAFAGGIIGTTLAVHLQTYHGWRNVFLLPSFIVGGMGVIVLLLFKSPEEVNVTIPGKETTLQASSSTAAASTPTFWQILAMPLIAEITVGVFCLKVVRYCMYMWLPMFLHSYLQYSKAQAGMFSVMFEVGGVVGSALIGVFIDRFFKNRSLVGTGLCMLLCTLSIIAFFVTSRWGFFVNSLWLLLAGLFNCGPDSILGGSIPVELGDADGRNAAAATVGFVNGVGSVGTFIQGPLVGILTSRWNWDALFYLLAVLMIIGMLSVYRAAYKYSQRSPPLPTLNPDL